ncbi:hypothetical protein QUF80_03495, partial [Desulfococcaceae bacterium HSG8]|nr:hypothetical protein [Desulfococcaceae bacterium HSG8]
MRFVKSFFVNLKLGLPKINIPDSEALAQVSAVRLNVRPGVFHLLILGNCLTVYDFRFTDKNRKL